MNTDNKPERVAINFTERSNQRSGRHFMFKDSVSGKPGALVLILLRGKRTRLFESQELWMSNFLVKNRYIMKETGDVNVKIITSRRYSRDEIPDSQN